MNKRNLSLLLGALLLFLSTAGCENTRHDMGKVLATINGEPIHAKELKRALALQRKRDPLYKVSPQTLTRQLNLLIDKRLLIQEAKKKNLDQSERFITTIKTFWEQTLIRDLVAHKHKEFGQLAPVPDKELRLYYENLRYRISCKIKKSKNRGALEEIAQDDPAAIAWDRETGPVGFDDVSSPVLFAAFSMKEKTKKIVESSGAFYLLYLVKKEHIPVAPFNEIKDEIAQKLERYKKRRLFNAWLKDIRKNADVKIDKRALKEYRYEPSP